MTDTMYFRNWRIVGTLFAVLTLMLGATGLAGWFYHEPSLRTFWSTGTEMKFNTAVGLALLGASLLLSFHPKKFLRAAGLFLATAMLVLTSLSLLEWLFGFNAGIDELVFKDTNLFRTQSPGRMAPQSAATFILLALGIFFMRSTSGRRRGCSQGIALASLFFPSQALVGYALGNMAIAGIGPQTTYMALPTALGFIFGAVALLLREPTESLIKSLTAHTPASLVFRRQAFFALFLPIILGKLVLHARTFGSVEQSPHYSVASFALVIIWVFVALTWLNAAQLNAAASALAQQEALLLESRERYRTLFNSIDEGFCIIEMLFDEAGRPVDFRFLETNPAFEKQTGLGDALGKQMRELKPDLENYWYEAYGKIALTGEPVRFENRAETMQRSFDVYAFRFGPPEKRQVAVIFSDVTARKQSEANAALLASINQALVPVKTVEEILDIVGTKVVRHLKLSSCCFAEVNEAADTSVVTHEWRRDANVPSLLGTYNLAEYVSADFQKVLRSGQVFAVNDTAGNPRTTAKMITPFQIGSFLCVPLVRDGQWKYMLNVHHSTPHEWRTDEIELMREIGTRLWTRLERAHAEVMLLNKEKELRITNERLNLATEAASIGAFEWNIQADVNYWSPQLEALYGLPPGGFTGRNASDWAKLLHPDDREAALADCERAIRHRAVFDTEFRVVWPDGTVRWLAGRARVAYDDSGKPLRMIGVNIDITDRKQVEQELSDAQSRLETTLAKTDVATWTWDIQNDRVMADKKLAQLFSLAEAEVAGITVRRIFAAIHPDDRARVEADFAASLASESGQYDTDYRVVQPDRSVRWVTGRGKVERDAGGKPVRFPGVIIDITVRKQAEALVRQNEGLFAALVEQAPTGVYVVDAQFRLQQINARALPAFATVDVRKGRDFSEVLNILWGQKVGDQLTAIFRQTLETGEPYVSPRFSEWRHDLNAEESYEWETQRVTLPDGQHGVVCYFSDITQNLRREKALLDAKLAAEAASRAKDEFLAALSHELRTPLNPALLIASESAADLELSAPVRQNFEIIRKNIELEARLIDDLLDLTRITSGKLALEKKNLDVHGVLADALATIQAERQEKNIQLQLKLAAPRFIVEGDAVRLQQVFWNVIKNAVKFTPPNGRITIETTVENGRFTAKISDTGIGMTAAEVARVFKAFAQGDHAGGGGSHRFGGLGLGLAISKNLVELHHGQISAASAGRNEGSQFTIELPPADGSNNNQPANKVLPRSSTENSASAARAVLLVEDHEPTRKVLAQLLQRRQYRVATAGSLAEARALARQNKFDLLISDIGLPDGNGHDLMNELRETHGLRGIALTGYGMEEDIARGKSAGFVAHLIKPVRIESLENALALLRPAA